MLQHCLGSGEGQGYHLFFGMENIEAGRQQGLQLLNGGIVQPVPSQLAYFVHVCGAEGAEGKQAVCHQCLVAAGEESTWVVEPLQGGARGYQVGFSGEVESFGITLKSRRHTNGNGREFSNTLTLLFGLIYKEVCEFEKNKIDVTAKDIARKYRDSLETFTNMPESEQKDLQLYSFICSLAFDVYVKKQVIEKLIDQMPEPTHKNKK